MPALSAGESRIADALDALLRERSHRQLGEELGIAGTTVDRRGGEIDNWPLRHGLRLARGDAALRATVLDYLREVEPEGSAVRAVEHATESMGRAGGLIAGLAEALRDQRVDSVEAAVLRKQVADVQAALKRLDSDLEAQARQRRS